MNYKQLQAYVDTQWQEHILPSLAEYIKIPNKSPHFDAQWQQHGYMEDAVQLISAWCKAHGPENMTLDILRLEGRTPLIFMDIEGHSDDCVLLYGHLDKQPEMSGWTDGLEPWKPVFRDDKLYGRGGADDGYAAYASLIAIKALQQQGIAHARCVVIIEACEESGSYDLPFYIDALKQRIGAPDLVVCLDSGCGNYDQLWMTTSLRGNIVGKLKVELIKEGVHSGNASGIVADSFRVARQLLSRLEDESTGAVKLNALNVDIPEERVYQAKQCAQILGEEVFNGFPFHDGVLPIEGSLDELVLNRTWRPALTITGANGLPPTDDAGNVTRPLTELKLSMRIPPTCDAQKGAIAIEEAMKASALYNARVEYTTEDAATGWNAPAVLPWLSEAANKSSQLFFGNDAAYMGEGGTIPFMGMLGDKFPDAQFMITGVLGPKSNAHGPNEFLHIPTAKRLTCCVAYVLSQHFLFHNQQ